MATKKLDITIQMLKYKQDFFIDKYTLHYMPL